MKQNNRAADLLQWYLQSGVDEVLEDQPVNRFRKSETDHVHQTKILPTHQNLVTSDPPLYNPSVSLKNKIAYKILQNDLKIFKDNINPDKYNGAIFIGVNGISIKSHGSANEYAFSYAIEKCYKFIKYDINSKIRNKFNLT